MSSSLLPPLSLSGGCARRPGGRHLAPCHPWHSERPEQLSVSAIRLLVGLSPAVPESEPESPGRHCSPHVTVEYVLAA